MLLVQKWPFFQLFFFKAIQARKKSFTTFQNQKTPFQAIKTKSSKGRKIDIFPKGLTHGFGPKMAIFPTFFFQAIPARKMPIYDILEPNNAFLGNKNKNFKQSKNSHYSKKVNACFWSKNCHFSNLFFLGNIGQENVFYDILEQTNIFLGYKNPKFKKQKNWCWSKNVLFSNFFFLGTISQENVFYDILEPKKTFLGYKNTKFKKSKN